MNVVGKSFQELSELRICQELREHKSLPSVALPCRKAVWALKFLTGRRALLRLRAGAVLEQLHRSSGTLDSLAHWYLYDLCGYLCGLEFSEKADLEDAYDTSWPLIDAAASKFRGGAIVQVEERLSTDKGREILERMGTPNVTSIMQGGT